MGAIDAMARFSDPTSSDLTPTRALPRGPDRGPQDFGRGGRGRRRARGRVAIVAIDGTRSASRSVRGRRPIGWRRRASRIRDRGAPRGREAARPRRVLEAELLRDATDGASGPDRPLPCLGVVEPVTGEKAERWRVGPGRAKQRGVAVHRFGHSDRHRERRTRAGPVVEEHEEVSFGVADASGASASISTSGPLLPIERSVSGGRGRADLPRGSEHNGDARGARRGRAKAARQDALAAQFDARWPEADARVRPDTRPVSHVKKSPRVRGSGWDCSTCRGRGLRPTA